MFLGWINKLAACELAQAMSRIGEVDACEILWIGDVKK